VPHGFCSRPERVAVVVYHGMPVVYFEETFAAQFDHITQGHAVIEIRMVNVWKHRHARLLALAKHSVDVSLQYFHHASPTLGWDQLLNVSGIDVDGFVFEPVGKLLRWNDKDRKS